MRLSVFLAVLLSIFLSTHAQSGNEGPHGGDYYANEFVELGKEIYSEISKPEHRRLLESTKLDATEFLKATKLTRVYSDESYNVKVGDQEVDAINILNEDIHVIVVSRSRWRMALLEQKLKLILHEYFGVLNLEKDTFTVSLEYKEILSTIRKRVLASQDAPVYYYGVGVGAPPLSFQGDICDLKLTPVVFAIESARNQALNKCQLERNNTCEVFEVSISRVRSQEFVGYTYCEILAIARLNTY